MTRPTEVFLGVVLAMASATTVWARGATRTGQTCAVDDDCARGHCHKKADGARVCVDCSASQISDFRGQTDRYCKKEPRKCDDVPATSEAPQSFFKVRIDNGNRCVTARDRENRTCWNGGDDGHRTAVKEAERARKKCHQDLGIRNGNGGIYTCSDTTYASRVAKVDQACRAYGKGCASWAKDSKPADCDRIEDLMDQTDDCVDALEALDRDCLPRLSKFRDNQYGTAVKAFDHCKAVLGYKRDRKLCE